MTRRKDGAGVGSGLLLAAWATVGQVVVMPLRLLLVTRVLLPTMDQRPAILSPDDPTKPGYRTPPIDVSFGDTTPIPDAGPPSTVRAVAFLDRMDRKLSSLE